MFLYQTILLISGGTCNQPSRIPSADLTGVSSNISKLEVSKHEDSAGPSSRTSTSGVGTKRRVTPDKEVVPKKSKLLLEDTSDEGTNRIL